jgi:hypothetical protein
MPPSRTIASMSRTGQTESDWRLFHLVVPRAAVSVGSAPTRSGAELAASPSCVGVTCCPILRDSASAR